MTVRGRGAGADQREQASLMQLNPQTAKVIPSPFGDFNAILKTLPGVVSNNELSSTYNVRGGNYGENLIYVNGFEVYRPFLVTQAQQEGLSFINPDLVQRVDFSTGGWQALSTATSCPRCSMCSTRSPPSSRPRFRPAWWAARPTWRPAPQTSG
ncbi:MAG: Plug domain-containing protein [Hymenobacter sp.]